MISLFQDEQSDFSAFPHMKDVPSCKSPSHPFSGLTSVTPCLFCMGDPRIGSSTLDEPHQCWVNGKDHLHNLLATLFLMQPRLPLSLWQGHVFTLVHQEPSWKAPLQIDISLFCCMRLRFSSCRSLHFHSTVFFPAVCVRENPSNWTENLDKNSAV